MTAAGTELADGLLANRYRLLERIAVGGMGEVWRAEDLLLSRPVAVKTLRSERSSESDRARFRAEARHAARLAHPGIASVYDFGETDDRAWLVMELVDGEPLSHLLHRDAPLPVERALDVVAQTAVALHAAHLGGVVHRDVKPGNLLLRPDGVLKVTDFGIASAVDGPSLTQTGLVVGTAYYLSPEQAAGRSGSPASDVYALGVVAYECLTGKRPFRGDSAVSVALAHLHELPPELPDSVPLGVRRLVTRALAKQPEDRFPDAAAMAEAARALLSGAPEDHLAATLPVRLPTRSVGSAPLPGAGRRSARAAVSSTLVLLVVLAAGAGVRSVLTGPDSPTTVTAVSDAPPADAPSADASSKGTAAVDRVPDAPAAGASRPTVDVDGYTGQASEQVRAALAEQGLIPRLVLDGTGAAAGTVSRVDPGGDVAAGTEVVVHVVPAPEPVAVDPAPPPVPDPVPPPVPDPAEAAPPPADKGGKPGKGGKGGKGDKGGGKERDGG